MLFLRTDWPKGHDTTDPKWWNDSPYLTRNAAQWVVDKKPSVVGYDFAQEEKGTDYQKADEILGSAMRVHRTILPKVIFQIENLINLDQIGSTAQVIALPVKWKTESAPARVVAILDN
jgi:kynurenine formamidase